MSHESVKGAIVEDVEQLTLEHLKNSNAVIVSSITTIINVTYKGIYYRALT